MRAAILRDLDAIVVVAVDQHHSIFGHDVEQPFKAQFDFVDVVKNIRVIELDVVHDHELREVMNELRALVEKRAVVFVAFDDEILRIV